MVLQATHIAKTFARKKILRDVSINVAAGTLCGIVGENGSGKSTLLKIIVGEWKADAGTVLIDGKMGYCPQKELLFPLLTVEEHFQYFAAAYGITTQEQAAARDRLLQHFHFEQYRHERVATLSGGTRQKLNLSLALLHQPALLILDEPYNGFDWDTYLRFWAYADELRAQGCAILVVTHLLAEKQRFDHIYDLVDGQLN